MLALSWFYRSVFVETKLEVLIFGNSHLLIRLAAALRDSPKLSVVERNLCEPPPGSFPPDTIIVDSAQVTPEQFNLLLDLTSSTRPIIIGVDPHTYQLTVLSMPPTQEPVGSIAQMIEIISQALTQTNQRRFP